MAAKNTVVNQIFYDQNGELTQLSYEFIFIIKLKYSESSIKI